MSGTPLSVLLVIDGAPARGTLVLGGRRRSLAALARAPITPRDLHHAAAIAAPPMLELLIARGARTGVRDTLWNGTPLEWAVHNGRVNAEAYLRSLTNS